MLVVSLRVSENPISSNLKSYELVTDQLVKEALEADKGKNVELLSFEIKEFTKFGDNFTCVVTSVVVKYRDEKGQHEDSFVAKLNALRNLGSFSDMMEFIFERETTVLSTFIGGMNKCLEKISQPPIKTPKLFARNLEKGREAFLMENLRSQGFMMHDRKKDMDYNHAKLVFEELGRYHASSLLYEDVISPKTFDDFYESFDISTFDENHPAFKPFAAMMNTQAVNASKYLKNIPKYEKCVKWLDTNYQNMGKYYVEGLKPRKPFDVLIHGDSWTNNILFKYDENNIPIDIRFVDLQISGKGSPVCDLLYFSYASLTGDFRSKYFQRMLYIYYQSFSKVLIFGRKKIPFTFKELEDEAQNRIVFGFVCGIFLLPGVFAEGDELMDFDNISEDKLDEFSESLEKKFSLISQREGPFKNRYLALFDDMLQSNIVEGN